MEDGRIVADLAYPSAQDQCICATSAPIGCVNFNRATQKSSCAYRHRVLSSAVFRFQRDSIAQCIQFVKELGRAAAWNVAS